MPVGIFQQDNADEIPDASPPLPPNVLNVPEHSLALYMAILLLCAAVQILASRSISHVFVLVGLPQNSHIDPL
jgi:hypothetical protein